MDFRKKRWISEKKTWISEKKGGFTYGIKDTSLSREQEEGEAIIGRNAIDEEVIEYDFGKFEHLVAYLILSHQVSFGVFLPLWIWDSFFFVFGETTS